jgi:carboxylesterase type B
MRDQVLALEFVRDNVAAFGGDPNQVTIFGQSAGGSSSALHLVSPMSQGLVNQAICESGADTNFWTLNWPLQRPEEYVYQTATRNGCANDTSIEEIIDCLREVPWEDFNRGIVCHVHHCPCFS